MASGGVPEVAICLGGKSPCRSGGGHRQPEGRWACLNQWLYITPKVVYFCASCLTYVFYVFRMNFYQTYLQMGPAQSGVIHSVWSVASFVGISVWGNLADAQAIHRPLIVALCLAVSVVFESISLKGFLPPATWIYLAVVVFGLHGLGMGGVAPLVDDQILKMLRIQFGGDTTAYGRQLMFGTVAYGAVTYGLGQLIARHGMGVLFGAVPLAAALCAISILAFGQDSPRPRSSAREMEKDEEGEASSSPTIIPVPLKSATAALYGRSRSPPSAKSFRGEMQPGEGLSNAQLHPALPHPEAATSAATTAEAPVSFRQYLGTLARPRFLALLITILASGFGRQTLAVFLPLYLTTELGLTSDQVAVTYLLGAFFSLIFYYVAPICLRRLGVRPMLLIGQTALIVRLALYVFTTPGPLALIAIEPLNGFSYSFTHVAAVQEAAECAPLGWEAAFQAAYGCMHVQFPAVFCSLAGGWVYEQYGGQRLLALAMITPAISIASLLVYFICKGCVRVMVAQPPK